MLQSHSNFRAVVPERQLRAFSKTFFCCQKVGGSNLMIETTRDACIFSTLNQTQSSFAKFVFNRQFFNSFRSGSPLKCRVNLKSLLLALRSLNSTKKCTFALNGEKNELVFHLTSHHGITREYAFAFDDLDSILQAEISRKELNFVSTRAKLFQSKILDNFASGLQEISITPTSNSLITKSYFEAESKNRLFYTECTVSSSDFEDFHVNPNTYSQEIVFPIKEIKAMVTFCKDLDYNVHLYFGMPGHPLVVSNSQDTKMDQCVEVVVSTLGAPESSQMPAPEEEFQQCEMDESQPMIHKEHPTSLQIDTDKSKKPADSSPFTPTQDQPWPSNYNKSSEQKRNTSQTDDRAPQAENRTSQSYTRTLRTDNHVAQNDNRSEVDSKATFDLYSPRSQNTPMAIESVDKTRSKRRKLDDDPEEQNINDERLGSDSDGEYVAGTPESE